ncbi:MAG: tRNA (adenosine(37)-N6)-threonylcarbamoyltransferase complex transferase subunit TsaD [Anaplasmataceae bacterium]|nr:tRNA (adenosine(37)-N6)-threonylcarbamoyltransferase complex transferase subunit TsaD [Anaplasmataceae bacterium]
MITLAIETTCDETSVAIMSGKNILSSIIYSQIEHQKTGGVIPEVAAREHMKILPKIIPQALQDANLTYQDLGLIAVAGGPGLITGVMIGVVIAKSLASVLKKPFIAINHLEGHIMVARMIYELSFPFITLLISGGHCQIILTKDLGGHSKLGGTIDDSLGEAFDKVARMLGLNYPGGPEIEKIALLGNETRFKFALPLANKKNCDFSFSGLKTSVLRQIQKIKNINQKDRQDIAASFQRCVVEILINRLTNILEQLKEIGKLVIAGGVAANKYIRSHLKIFLNLHNIELITLPMHLCTDNAIMIGWTAIEYYQRGITSSLIFDPKARWPLEELKV